MVNWERELDWVMVRDRKTPPVDDWVVFLGSSVVRLWHTSYWFPGCRYTNRGVAGATLVELSEYAGRLLNGLCPRLVVVYGGDNDLECGRSPASVSEACRCVISTVRGVSPSCHIVWVSIKPSPRRWHLRGIQYETNYLMSEVVRGVSNSSWVDVWSVFLGRDGLPDMALVTDDGLHPNQDGYRVLTDRVRPYMPDPPWGWCD